VGRARPGRRANGGASGLIRLALTGLVLCVLASTAFAATMPAVQMTFVDAEDGRPVAGASVLFQGSAHEGTLTGHGGKTASLFAVEGVTDESGRLALPRQEFSTQPFFLNTIYDNPSMVVLRAGYAMRVLMNTRRIIAERQDITSWQHSNATITLKRATPDDMTPHTIYLAATYASQAMGGNPPCDWKKLPRFLVTLDRLAGDWTRAPTSHPDEAIRRSTFSPLRRLFMNDQLYVDAGCGSPKAFFEPYLR
jgi:hypothetical protein